MKLKQEKTKDRQKENEKQKVTKVCLALLFSNNKS